MSSLSVVSGPVLGGTTLVVQGSGFVNAARVDMLCRFGRFSVPASFVSSTQLRCTSPTAELASAAALLSFDFSEDDGVSVWAPALLPGEAYTDGVLQLTNGDFSQEAAALISAPVALADARYFEAAFDLYVGGDFSPAGSAVGESISFCVGDLSPIAPISEYGVADGLCVAFIEYLDTISITLDGEPVASSRCADGALSSAGWMHARVQLLDNRVSVLHGDAVRTGAEANGEVRWRSAAENCTAALSGLELPGPWSPRDGWRFGLGGRTGFDRAATHWVDSLRITVGALLASTPSVVEVSLSGGQHYTDDGVAFTYLGEPHLRAVFPVSGPAGGGTYLNLTARVAANFDNLANISCVFNVSTSDESLLTPASWDGALLWCRTPPVAAAGKVVVRATGVKDGYSLDLGDGVEFVFYSPPVVELLEPNSGPSSGDTRLVLYGDGFAHGIGPYWCRCASQLTPATMSPVLGVLRCSTPPANGSSGCPIEVTLNGQQYTPSLETFDFYDPPRVWSISPASGSTEGGVLVTVTGASFQSSFRNLCRWDGDTTNVTSLSPTELVCASPPRRFGAVALELSQNGQQFSTDGGVFSYYAPPRVTRLSVPGVQGEYGSWQEQKITHPIDGYIMVRVWGAGFNGGTDYRCQIGPHAPIVAVYDEQHDCIQCWSDLWIDGENRVEVTLNGRQYTTDNMNASINLYWTGYSGGTYATRTDVPSQSDHLPAWNPVDTNGNPVIP